MPGLRFVGSAAELPPHATDTVLVGHKPALLAWIGSVAGLQATVVPQLAAGLTPGTDDGVTAETFLAPAAAGAPLRRVALAMLPTACSRHNTPSHAHAITKLVRASMKGGGATVNVVLVLSDAAHASAAACAVARAFPTYSLKSAAPLAPEVTVALVGAAAADIGRASLAAAGVRRAAALVDAPTSELHTTAFVAEAQAVYAALRGPTDPLLGARGQHVVIHVIAGEELRKQGLGGLYGVGKAAAHPPALVVLSYTPPGATTNVAWVGKGIVYDTGGLSIKGKEGMPGMKTDMGGAAAVPPPPPPHPLLPLPTAF
jgi:probable aminopeptidase NPEPL1